MSDRPSTPSLLERLLFGSTRLLAVVVGALCLIAIGAGVFSIITSLRSVDTHVSYNDLKTPAVAPTGTADNTNAIIPDVILPINVQTHLSGDNRKVLRGWLEGLDADQKREFLTNLSEVIENAEHSSANVVAVINSYKTMKLEKLKSSTMDRYATQVRRGAMIGFVGLMMLVLVMTSLCLVLLSVERNTRAVASASPGTSARL
jgi:hypothetical protein